MAHQIPLATPFSTGWQVIRQLTPWDMALRQVSCQEVVDGKVHSHQSALAANLPQSDSTQMMSVARNLTKSRDMGHL